MESDSSQRTGDPPPEISIITPCYNAVRHLRDAIESIRRQEGVRVEHIVVDAASKDGTVDILREYPDVRWISEPDQGQADAFNKGLAMARAPLSAGSMRTTRTNRGRSPPSCGFFASIPGRYLRQRPPRPRRFGREVSWNFCPANRAASGCGTSGSAGTGSITPRRSTAKPCSTKSARSTRGYTTRWITIFICGRSQRFEFYDIDLLTTRMLVHPDAKTSHGWDNFAADVQRTLAKVWKPQHPLFYAYSLLGVRMYAARSHLVESFIGLREGRRKEHFASWDGPPPGGPCCPCCRAFTRTAAGRDCEFSWANHATRGFARGSKAGKRLQSANAERLASGQFPSLVP